MWIHPSLKSFPSNLLEGDPATCLDEPNTILLAESKVNQYFPEGDPIGKSIAMNDDSTLFRVTGIVEDAPTELPFLLRFSGLLLLPLKEAGAQAGSTTTCRPTSWFGREPISMHLMTTLMPPCIENIRPQLEAVYGHHSRRVYRGRRKIRGIYPSPD